MDKRCKSMTILVTGIGGQLGHDVMNELNKRGHTGIGSDTILSYGRIADGSSVSTMPYAQLDITDADAVRRVLLETHPDAVIHCAAWTDVDQAEGKDNIGLVRAVNAGGTRNIANVCRELDCKMLYISTDYVFGGQGTDPREADCKAFAPLNVYGETKLEGEMAVANTLEKFFIVRTAGLFGTKGNNFIQTMLRLGQIHDTLKVVNDQIGRPTYTHDLARLLTDMISTEKYGYYHATNEGGYISWYDFACEIFRQAGCDVNLIPVSTKEYGLNRAARPLNGRLDTGKLARSGFLPLPTWQDALGRYLKDIHYVNSGKNGTD